KIGPDPRNFNQRVSLGRNDLLIRTFLSAPPQYHDIDNHNKCVVNGASIALLILRLRQNICQVFATE
ncbi:hypothetical protein P2O48_22345, partial [Escherichia coli]